MPYGQDPRQSTVYLNASCGQLRRRRADKSFDAFGYAEGRLEEITIVRRPKSGEIREHDELQIVLQDDRERIVIASHHPSTFSYMFARHLPCLEKGSHLRLEVWLVPDTTKVTGCKVFLIDASGEPVNISDRRAEFASPVRDERLAMADAAIRSHACFRVDVPKESEPQTREAYGCVFEMPRKGLGEAIMKSGVEKLREEVGDRFDLRALAVVAARRFGLDVKPESKDAQDWPRGLASMMRKLAKAYGQTEFDADVFDADYDVAQGEIERLDASRPSAEEDPFGDE